MIDIFFWGLELAFLLYSYLMIVTGEIILTFCSLGYHRKRRNKNIFEEHDSLIPIASPSFWVGVIFWICIGIYLNFYLSGK